MNFRVYTSVTSLVFDDERPLLMVFFLEHVANISFTADSWAGAQSVYSAIISLSYKTFF